MTRENSSILAYVAPFATWIVLQTVLPVTAWAYAVRALATALVALACFLFHRRRPSCAAPASLPPRTAGLSGGLAVRTSLWGAAAGVLVAVLWIVPECSDFYRTWFCWPPGSLPPVTDGPSPYDPAVCGWALTVAKLIGSAFVIAPVEEIFFRSFLYRWLQRRDFLAVPLERFDRSAFLWMIFLFLLEHDRPLAAAVAGAVYGLLAIRVNLASAVLAHVITNLLLALHVICSKSWSFW